MLEKRLRGELHKFFKQSGCLSRGYKYRLLNWVGGKLSVSNFVGLLFLNRAILSILSGIRRLNFMYRGLITRNFHVSLQPHCFQ